MFDEYSSDDEDCNPYTFDKCKYGHYISAGGFCCYACKKEYSDKQSDEYMKHLFQQFLIVSKLRIICFFLKDFIRIYFLIII